MDSYICFLQSDNNQTKINIINKGELEENICGYVVCSWNEVKQMVRMKLSTHLPLQFKLVSSFVKLANFAQIAEFISSFLNENVFKSTL